MWKLVLLTFLLSLCSWLQNPPSPAEKITFTRPNACVNDGSVEFCVPKNNPQLLSEVQKIAPQVACMPSSGRAHCDTTTQTLCLVPVDAFCTQESISDMGWQILLELAALPEIDKIGPTFYE